MPAPAQAQPLRMVRALNGSPLTLDGTRTYLVGIRRLAIIDPGPDMPDHLSAVARACADGAEAIILLTHSHPDHAAGAMPLAHRLGAPVRSLADGSLAPGDVVPTDCGALIAVGTPGHTADHTAFHWPTGRAVFVGDLMLGGQDSALVAPPEGDLTDYLDSLDRIAALQAGILYPSHGPPFENPSEALASYTAHRASRLRQVLAALDNGPATVYTILDAVYGTGIESTLREAAGGATRAYLEHLRRRGMVKRVAKGRWARV